MSDLTDSYIGQTVILVLAQDLLSLQNNAPYTLETFNPFLTCGLSCICNKNQRNEFSNSYLRLMMLKDEGTIKKCTFGAIFWSQI